MFRALALGASAVGLGRPYVWGLAAGGEDGVREVIRNLRADFDLTMGLAGVSLGERHRTRQRDARLSRVEAVVFDLDGVLIDSEHVWDEVREELARERGGRWHDARAGGHDGHELDRVVALHARRHRAPEPPEEINDEVVRRMLGAIRERAAADRRRGRCRRRLAGSFRLALASSSNRPLIDAVLAKPGSHRSSRSTVSSEEVARGKPAPDVFLEAARRLGVAPDAAPRSRTRRTASAPRTPPACV